MSDHHIKGSCHCGNIELELTTKTEPGRFLLRRCGCDFCVKHGGLYTSDPSAHLDIRIKDAAAMNRYQFGHKTAEFLICRSCGVFPAVVCKFDDNLKAVLNVNCIEPTLFSPDSNCPVNDFDGEDVDSRLERRGKNWIGSVHIEENTGQ